ncbi:MAG: DLW-39 family protein [Streptosporangiaceae bacterium]
MKKLVALVVVVLGGVAIWRWVQQDRAEQDLWTEAVSAPDRG